MKTDKTDNCRLCAEVILPDTKICDRCRELKRRIEGSPEVAKLWLQKSDNQILGGLVMLYPELARKILTELLNELKGMKNEG